MVAGLTVRKGGAGKTMLASNLASIWAEAGNSVLLVDFDAQADSSEQFNIYDDGEALAAALTGAKPLEEAIRATSWGFDLAPAGEALAEVADTVRIDSVDRCLRQGAAQAYDVIVLDCAAALTRLTASAWHAIDARDGIAVAPVDGPRALRKIAVMDQAWRDLGLDTSRMRIVLNRHDHRRIIDQRLEQDTEARYGPAVLTTRIRDSIVVQESSAYREPLIELAPRHPLTRDIRALAAEVHRG